MPDSDHPDGPIRIWYQGFTDPVAHKIYVDRLQTHISSVSGENVSVEFHGIDPPAAHLHDIEELRCSLAAMANALKAQERGYDAFAMGHFQEAGIHEIKAMLDIPVLSLGEASMLYACSLGRKIGLVTINPVFIPWHEDQVKLAGLSDRVVGVRAMTTTPAEYMEAFANEDAFEDVFRQFKEQAQPLLDRGADVLIPAGGLPMMLLSRKAPLTIDGAIVMNGVNVLVRMTETAVRLKRLDGLAVSRRSNYAKPSDAALSEFRNILT